MNSLIAQVHSLPELLRTTFDECDAAARGALRDTECAAMDHLYLTGCGDSHHVGLATEWAFHMLAGVPTRALTALQMGRYTAGHLAVGGTNSMVIGVSVSGSVARTTEAIQLARQAGARTVALTSSATGRLATEADQTLLVPNPFFPDPTPHGTPGTRTYCLNQLTLFLLAIHMGTARGRLSRAEADAARTELRMLTSSIEETITSCDQKLPSLLERWEAAGTYTFLGSGPNYATALFSAAKVLEASGDVACGQDTEEWAHLQYYLRSTDTVTSVTTAGGRDLSRATEILDAVRSVGGHALAVAPFGTWPDSHDLLQVAANVQEVFSPLVMAIPGELLAGHRADQVGEVFFRADRPLAVSRIRSSETVEGRHPLVFDRT